jgi:hypothetical protein
MYLVPTGDSSRRILPMIEVVARGSFGRKVVDDCLNFGLFELVRGFQKMDEGFRLIR